MSRRKYSADENKIMDEVRNASDICYYCGKEVKTSSKTVDHKKAYTKGGKTVKDNLVMCCSRCNSEKADLDMDTYMRVREYIDLKLSKDIVTKHIEDGKKVYQSILDEIANYKQELTNVKREIGNVQNLIMTTKMNACEGYKLAKSLQDLLCSKIELSRKIGESSPSTNYANNKLQLLIDDEYKLRNKYKQEFLKNNKNKLTKSVDNKK